MKYWMLSLSCFTLLPFTHLMASSATGSAAAADALFREGIAYCNQASRLSRTDSKQARQQFERYQTHLERAQAIDASLLENNAFIQREHKRCALIEVNIARAEAMPVVEQSLAQCAAAQAALDAGQLAKASTSLKRFQTLRDEALAVTPTVLRVGSVAVRMRVCDRLVEKIALAESARQIAAQTVGRAQGHFNKAMASCEVGQGMLNSQGPTTDTLRALESVVNQVETHTRRGQALLDAMSAREAAAKLDSVSGRLHSCQQALSLAATAIQQHLEQQEEQAAHTAAAASGAAQPTASPASVLQGQEISQIVEAEL